MEEEIKYLMTLPEEDLLEMLVPKLERHSPDSDVPRGRYVFKQCVVRSKDAIISFCKEHQGEIEFTQEMAVALIPVLSNTVPATFVGVFAVLLLKYGIKNFI